MAIAEFLGRSLPCLRIAEIVGLRASGVLHSVLQEADLTLGIEAVPIEPLLGSVGARRCGSLQGSL